MNLKNKLDNAMRLLEDAYASQDHMVDCIENTNSNTCHCMNNAYYGHELWVLIKKTTESHVYTKNSQPETRENQTETRV